MPLHDSSPPAPAREFTDQLVGLCGDALVSVVLYGSAARGEYREGVSDLNLLVVLRQLDVDGLRRLSGVAREWSGAGNPPPLLMSEAELRDSADVFPIEYADILDARRVLHGEDVFQGMRVEHEHLRLRCEHELKSKQIQLREHFLLAADEPERIGQLLAASFSTFVALFRAVLRLAGREVPRDTTDVVQEAGRVAGFEAGPLLEVARARAQGRGGGFAPDAEGPVVAGYLGAVARTAAWLDRLGEQEPQDASPAG